jgi:hypothetical protein
MAEGVGFEPTLGFPLSLISSQVPSTTQPPFRFQGKSPSISDSDLRGNESDDIDSRWQKYPQQTSFTASNQGITMPESVLGAS